MSNAVPRAREREWPARIQPSLDGRGLQIGLITYLTIYISLLYLINARFIFAPLGAVGTPAMLVGALAPIVWVSAQVLPQFGLQRSATPIRIALLLHAWYMLFSWAWAHTRPLSDIEVNGAHRAAVALVVLTGIALLINDAVKDFSELDHLLHRLFVLGVLVGSIGALQFFTGTSIYPSFLDVLPGFSWSRPPLTVGERSIFNRPASTTLHPIEFSVLMAALLPLAIHYALFARTKRAQRWSTAGALIIGLGVPFSVSRSGIVAIIASLGILILGWGWRRRLIAMLTGIVGLPILWLTVPGLVGTMRSMFTGAATDDSVQARIERIPEVMEFVRERPILGRGRGTFNPEEYLLVDNGVFGITIEAGLVGLTILYGMLLTSIALGLSLRSRQNCTAVQAHLGRCLAAGITAVALSYYTFDTMSFNILSATIFVFIGAIGALWRLTAPRTEGRLGSDRGRVVKLPPGPD